MTKALRGLSRFLPALMVGCVVGCGSGEGSSSAGVPAVAPLITMQPADESIPMGLSGSFSVQAAGSNLHYQWSRGGSSIPGATASTYTTSPTEFSDSGSLFTVSVSDAEGSVTSRQATLTVTARAPKVGDLRFQQVDAASTINGYTVANSFLNSVFCPGPGAGGSGVGVDSATGTGIFLTNNTCGWQFSAFTLPAGVTGLGVGYSGVAMQSYPGVLDQSLLDDGGTADDPGSVITSLILNQPGSAGLAFIHSETTTGFERTISTVPAASLEATAAQEGLRGRVVTAISYDGSQATYCSYGWTGDPSTVYEVKVVFTTLAAATAAIQELAQEGYVLTASGSTEAADGSGVILLGTRVQGDSMPRPFLVGDVLMGNVEPVFQQGYAVVAVITEYQSNGLILKNYIGER